MKVVLPKGPKFEMFWPIWWHHHGSKIQVQDGNRSFLILSSSAARLKIQKLRENDTLWAVEWEVMYSPTSSTTGTIVMNNELLKSAFGLSDLSGDYGEWLIKRFGGTSAQQGKYIRWEKWLNIPGPGTGHDGDANISIQVDDQIKTAIGLLLGIQSESELKPKTTETVATAPIVRVALPGIAPGI